MPVQGASPAPQVALSRRYRFSASHRLHVASRSAEWNRELFGKCNNPHGHGHNYTLQVTLGGEVSPQTGMVVDLGALDRFVEAEVLERFHLASLNDDPAFGEASASTEHLAILIWELLSPFAPGRLQRIRIEETGNNAFDYFGHTVPADDGQGDSRREASKEP